LQDGLPVEDWEREHPILLHGRAGVQLAETVFGILDDEIKEAIACHTTGRPGMGILAKIVFIADYIAPDREHVTDAYRSELFRFSLDRQVLTVLRDLIVYLEGRGMFIAPPSMALRRELEKVVADG
jgi:nicotinate-nucleotide adenylyltransferase